VLAAAVWVVPVAGGNGVDLARFEGRPGEEIAVAGHFWLGPCCPPAPYAHVRLWLVTPDERIELFDEPADRNGSVFAAFTVPDVPPGTYPLEPCGQLDGRRRVDCRPGTTFQVLAGGTSGGGGSGVTVALTLVAVVAFAGSVAALVLALRRRT
jgi:hypothetical protein